MARLTQDQWRTLIDEHAASGQTAMAFCAERGIDNKCFSTRTSQLSKPSAAGGFVAVSTKPIENQHIQLYIGSTQLRIPICFRTVVGGCYQGAGVKNCFVDPPQFFGTRMPSAFGNPSMACGADRAGAGAFCV